MFSITFVTFDVLGQLCLIIYEAHQPIHSNIAHATCLFSKMNRFPQQACPCYCSPHRPTKAINIRFRSSLIALGETGWLGNERQRLRCILTLCIRLFHNTRCYVVTACFIRRAESSLIFPAIQHVRISAL